MSGTAPLTFLWALATLTKAVKTPTLPATPLNLSQNSINRIEPQLMDPTHGNFHPSSGGTLYKVATYVIPDFSWNDAPTTPRAPAGNVSNSVQKDRDGNIRHRRPPGAYIGGSSTILVTVASSPKGANYVSVDGRWVTTPNVYVGSRLNTCALRGVFCILWCWLSLQLFKLE